MRDLELYEFLEDVSGVKLYENKKHEALANIENASKLYCFT
jgi:chromosome segregation ATPase